MCVIIIITIYRRDQVRSDSPAVLEISLASHRWRHLRNYKLILSLLSGKAEGSLSFSSVTQWTSPFGSIFVKGSGSLRVKWTE